MAKRQGIGNAAGAVRVTAAANYPATYTEQLRPVPPPVQSSALATLHPATVRTAWSAGTAASGQRSDPAGLPKGRL